MTSTHTFTSFAESPSALSHCCTDLQQLWPHSVKICWNSRCTLSFVVQICRNSCCTLSLLYRFQGTLATLPHFLYRFAGTPATLCMDLPEPWPHSVQICRNSGHSVQICQNSGHCGGTTPIERRTCLVTFA